MKSSAEPTVGGIPGHDDGLPPRRPSDRALPEIVLPRPDVTEPLLVVPELTKDTGREDHPQTRLAEINISRRVPTKMLVHHLLQLRDLFVQRGDDADLPKHDGSVGCLGDRRLLQPRRPQHRQQCIRLGLDVVPSGSAQRGHHLAAGQRPDPRRDGARASSSNESFADRSSKASTAAGKYSSSVDLIRSTCRVRSQIAV